MEWLVIDSLYLSATGHHALILHAGDLKILAEITSVQSVSPGDILYPVNDATWLINNHKNAPVKIISTVTFSVTHWSLLKKLSVRRMPETA